MEVIFQDRRILVAVKPAGVLSTDEPGGMPELIRAYLGDDKACVRTVHRLDQTVSGLMVFARSRAAAGILSGQVREHGMGKEYLAVIHGAPEKPEGTLRDLLLRDKNTRCTRVAAEPGKDVKEAILHYRVLETRDELSLVHIKLETGRTHQIRVQFSSRGLPLWGDKRYGISDGGEQIALWSVRLYVEHPETGEKMTFFRLPPWEGIWSRFQAPEF
ncbi:MAG: RluA family pseudouridine synthase [Oscillospiraceae bacterium]|nr:RluA family pseudouridine synthase [Oscillospiraceae bacterium]